MRNRVCVLLSRAQHGMYILGNADTLRAARGQQTMWPQVRKCQSLDNVLSSMFHG
jgi:hypothetical protein